MKKIIFLILCLIFYSCNDKNEANPIKEAEKEVQKVEKLPNIQDTYVETIQKSDTTNAKRYLNLMAEFSQAYKFDEQKIQEFRETTEDSESIENILSINVVSDLIFKSQNLFTKIVSLHVNKTYARQAIRSTDMIIKRNSIDQLNIIWNEILVQKKDIDDFLNDNFSNPKVRQVKSFFDETFMLIDINNEICFNSTSNLEEIKRNSRRSTNYLEKIENDLDSYKLSLVTRLLSRKLIDRYYGNIRELDMMISNSDLKTLY